MTIKTKRLAPEIRAAQQESKRRGWSVEKLAVESGLSHQTLSEMFRGARDMSFAAAIKLDRAFGWTSERRLELVRAERTGGR